MAKCCAHRNRDTTLNVGHDMDESGTQRREKEKRQWSGAVNGIDGLHNAPSTPHKTRDSLTCPPYALQMRPAKGREREREGCGV